MASGHAWVLVGVCGALVAGCGGGAGGDEGGADAGSVLDDAGPDTEPPEFDHCAVGEVPAGPCAAVVCYGPGGDDSCCEVTDGKSGWDESCVLEALLSCAEPCPATGLFAIEPSLEGFAGGDPEAEGRVQPVLVVPSDLREHPDLPYLSRLVERAAREGQGLLAAATGETVALSPLIVADGSASNADYQAGDGVEARSDGIAASGRTDRDQIAWIVWFGGGGYAGAYGDEPGFDLELSAMVGTGSFYTHIAHVTGDLRWCDHILEEAFAEQCRNQEWIITAGMGGFIHELGHSLGLGHEDDHGGAVPGTSIMNAHWNYFQVRSPDTAGGALSEDYKDTIRESRFAAPAP